MEEIAQVYARSLFEVAKEHGKLDSIKSQLGQFADAVEQNRDLAVFFFSPYFATEEKKDGLHRSVEGAEPELQNFLELLIENHRMPVLFRLRREYDVLWDHENRRLAVQVTTAVALDPAIVAELGTRVGQQTGQNVDVSSKVDPDILGGMVLRVGNSILDASIRHRLDQLRREVVKAT
jgi:F-type H+-transporting ATPase subunit delta